MTPFERFFSGSFQGMLKFDVPDDRDALSSGFSIRSASWDRRAAYLLWKALGEPECYQQPGAADWTPPAFDAFRQQRYPPAEQIDLEEAIAAAPPVDLLDDILGGPAPSLLDDILG